MMLFNISKSQKDIDKHTHFYQKNYDQNPSKVNELHWNKLCVDPVGPSKYVEETGLISTLLKTNPSCKIWLEKL